MIPVRSFKQEAAPHGTHTSFACLNLLIGRTHPHCARVEITPSFRPYTINNLTTTKLAFMILWSLTKMY
jgi:hypothetical protein